MRIKLLYFGVLKDLLPPPLDAEDIPEATTVAALLRLLRQRTSNHTMDDGTPDTPNDTAASRSEEQIWRSLAVAVNREYAGPGTVLREGDEVALLPPVSGGGGRR